MLFVPRRNIGFLKIADYNTRVNDDSYICERDYHEGDLSDGKGNAFMVFLCLEWMDCVSIAICGADICFSYDMSAELALDGINICINSGEFVAILGHNGCGKSTLAKHCNALLPLQHGTLMVLGIDVENEDDIWKLRRRCGMIFQNPDNQFVSTLVEEDIAFGLENYEVPRHEIPQRVHRALQLVGMEGYEKRAPQTLSGGQKQRVALAGVLALEPEILLFDEATSMLDPEGRHEVLKTIDHLHRKEHKTILMISHNVEEAVFADRILIMHHGKILASGAPADILTDLNLLNEAGLAPPTAVQCYYDLKKSGILLRRCPLTNEDLVEELCRLN